MVTARPEVRPPADSTAPPVRTRRFSVDEYHRLIDAGILGEDEHVELLEGALYEMSPQGEPHARVVERLTRLLIRALGEEYRVRPQLPLTFGDSEPEPDLAVVREGDGPRDDHPRTALLVVEVSRSSLAHDRTVKARVYARAGVPELWIVDIETRRVEVRRDPDPASGHYRRVWSAGVGDSLACASLPGLTVGVQRLFD
jgi:Uma2 family endonuclease